MTNPERGFLKRRATYATRTQGEVWRHFAEVISETGRSPAYRKVAEAIHSSEGTVKVAVQALLNKGYLRMTGQRHAAVVHIVKWPEGITPRETEGRADKADTGKLARAPVKYERPIAKPPAPKPNGHQPNLERGPNTCATPSCRYPRQPGRDHCASCLQTKMPARQRAHMFQPMSVGGVANS